MTAFHYVLLAAGTVMWFVPFILVRRPYRGTLTRDRRARWGLILEGVGYTLLWQGSFWAKSPAVWQSALATASFVAACVLSWRATFALGRQLRIDAAVQADHRLIQSGPYRLVRHPVYTSMLAVLVGTGILVAPWYLLAPGLALFLLGTAIRVRVEEALLESRFGDEFRQYRRTVPALIPFVG